jgi:hypothetical protein
MEVSAIPGRGTWAWEATPRLGRPSVMFVRLTAELGAVTMHATVREDSALRTPDRQTELAL